jgi:hypothetical protein
MGSIQIFETRLANLVFACRRDFAGGYRLDVGAFSDVPLSVANARRLAGTAARIRGRAQSAVNRDGDMRPGPLYRKEMPTADGAVCRVEIGITDAGDAVYIEIGDARVRLDETEAQDLLYALERLGDDVSSLDRFGGGAQQFILDRRPRYLWPY